MPLLSRRSAAPILASLALAAFPPGPLSGGFQPPQAVPETRRAETVAPGVEHIEILRGDFAEGRETDRWTIHLLVLDPRLIRLDSALAMDEIAGAETTSSLAARRGALAAVNGGYFRTTGIYRGEPAGMYAAGGKVLSEPNGPRMEMAVSNAGEAVRIAFSNVAVRSSVTAEDGGRRMIDGINRPRGDDEIILFTPEFHRTTLTPGGGLEIAVRADRVASAADGPGSNLVPADGYVLSAGGAAREWALARFRPGSTVRIEIATRAEPPMPFEPDWIVGAGPLLVRAGEALGAGQADAEGFASDFSRGRHPRTALGVRADGLIVLAVVDGRQPKISVGMTIAELSALMAESGCREAINLDGGGSTTMVAGGRVVNHPSDASGERPVSDALLVRARR
jgi:hypothetical protein